MLLAQSLSPTRPWSQIWNLSLRFSPIWVSRSKQLLLRVFLLLLLLSENKFRSKSKRTQLSPLWRINSSMIFYNSEFFISNSDMPSRHVGHQQTNKFEILWILPVQTVQTGQMTIMVSFRDFWLREINERLTHFCFQVKSLLGMPLVVVATKLLNFSIISALNTPGLRP